MRKHWLNKARLTTYPRIFIALYLVGTVVWLSMSHHGLDRYQKPLGYDFITYWAASHLALSGEPAAAYNLPAMVREERTVVPGNKSVYPWLYPPQFYLLILPLSLLPYFLSYIAFLGATFGAYLGVVRKVMDVPGSLALLLAFPGGFVNFIQGQNGFLTAALIGAALLLLTSRPVWAGILIGLLTIKPQLGLLLPVALVCGRYWRVLFYAALTSSVFLALSVALLGVDTLGAFLSGMREFSGQVIRNPDLMMKIPSFFSFACLLGAPTWAAYALQGAMAMGVAAIVGWIWLRCPDMGLRSAALVSGSLIASPYVQDYDLVWLALPIALMAGHGLRHGWLRWEREALAAAWLMPMCLVAIYKLSHVQLSAFLLLGLFLMIVRRVFADRSRTRGPQADDGFLPSA